MAGSPFVSGKLSKVLQVLWLPLLVSGFGDANVLSFVLLLVGVVIMNGFGSNSLFACISLLLLSFLASITWIVFAFLHFVFEVQFSSFTASLLGLRTTFDGGLIAMAAGAGASIVVAVVGIVFAIRCGRDEHTEKDQDGHLQEEHQSTTQSSVVYMGITILLMTGAGISMPNLLQMPYFITISTCLVYWAWNPFKLLQEHIGVVEICIRLYSSVHLFAVTLMRLDFIGISTVYTDLRLMLGVLPTSTAVWRTDDGLLLLALVCESIMLFVVGKTWSFTVPARLRWARKRMLLGDSPLLQQGSEPFIRSDAQVVERTQSQQHLESGIGLQRRSRRASVDRKLSRTRSRSRSKSFRRDASGVDLRAQRLRSLSRPVSPHPVESSFMGGLKTFPHKMLMAVLAFLRGFELLIFCSALVSIALVAPSGLQLGLLILLSVALMLPNELMKPSAAIIFGYVMICTLLTYVFAAVAPLRSLVSPLATSFRLDMGSEDVFGVIRVLSLFLSAIIVSLFLRLGDRVATSRGVRQRHILMAAAAGDTESLTKLLRDNLIDVLEARDKQDQMRSAMHLAALGGHLDVVSMLIELGASKLAVVSDTGGRVPADLAADASIALVLNQVHSSGEKTETSESESPAKSWLRVQLKALRRFLLALLFVHGSKVALLCVFVVGVSRVDILHMISLLMCLVYIAAPKLSLYAATWMPMTLYAFVVFLVLYASTVFQNVAVFDVRTSTTLGTIVLDPIVADALLPLLGTALCVFQLRFLRIADKSAWLQDQITLRSDGILSRLTAGVGDVFANFGPMLVFFVMMVVATQGPISLINLMYMFLALFSATISLITNRLGLPLLRAFWPVHLSYTAAVVFLQYAVQFSSIHDIIKSAFDELFGSAIDGWISFSDLGLPVLQPGQNLARHLVPAIAVFLLCVAQFRVEFFTTPSASPRTRFWLSFLNRQGKSRLKAWSLHFSRLLMLSCILIYCVRPSASSGFIVTIAAVLMMPSLLDLAWFPLLVFTALSVMTRYMFQLPGLLNRYGKSGMAAWIGYVPLQDGLWTLSAFGGDFLLIVLACLARYFARRATLAPDMRSNAHLVVAETEADDEERAESSSELSVKNSMTSIASKKVKSLLSRALVVLARITDTEIAPGWKTEMAVVSLAMAAAARRTSLSLLTSLTIVPLYVLGGPHRVRKYWAFFVFVVLLPAVILQAWTALGSPTAELESSIPWIAWSVSESFKRWLLLALWAPHLAWDYIALWFCFRVLRRQFGDGLAVVAPVDAGAQASSNVVGDSRGSVELAEVVLDSSVGQRGSEVEPAVEEPVIDAAASSAVESPSHRSEDKPEFAFDEDSWAHKALSGGFGVPLQVLFRIFPTMLALVIFVMATMSTDLIHLIYMLMAASLLLAEGTSTFRKKSSAIFVWYSLRLYNLAVPVAFLLYEFPHIYDNSPRRISQKEHIDKVFGFRDLMTAADGFRKSAFLTSLVIHCVLDLHRHFHRMTSAAFDHIRQMEVRAGESRFFESLRLFRRSRAFAIARMRRIREDLRASLLSLLTDTARLGLARMADEEVWPSLPAQTSATFVVDKESNIVQWSDEMALLTQRNSHDAIGRYALDILPVDAARVLPDYHDDSDSRSRSRNRAKDSSCRVTLLKKESRLRVAVDIRSTPLREEGHIVGAVVFVNPVNRGGILASLLYPRDAAQGSRRARSSSFVEQDLDDLKYPGLELSHDGSTVIAINEPLREMLGDVHVRETLHHSVYNMMMYETDRVRLQEAIDDVLSSHRTPVLKSILASISVSAIEEEHEEEQLSREVSRPERAKSPGIGPAPSLQVVAEEDSKMDESTNLESPSMQNVTQDRIPGSQLSSPSAAAAAVAALDAPIREPVEHDSVLVVEMSLRPRFGDDGNVAGVWITMKRHHLHDVTVSFFRRIVSSVKVAMTKLIDPVLWDDTPESPPPSLQSNMSMSMSMSPPALSRPDSLSSAPPAPPVIHVVNPKLLQTTTQRDISDQSTTDLLRHDQFDSENSHAPEDIDYVERKQHERDLVTKMAERTPFLTLFWRMLTSHVEAVCICTYILAAVAQGSLVALLPVLVLFVGGIFENPRVPPRLFRALLTYSSLVVLVKFLFQLDLFCVGYSAGEYHLRGHRDCQAPEVPDDTGIDLPICGGRQCYASLIGIDKASGSLLAYVLVDALCVLSVLAHLNLLRRKGVLEKSEFQYQYDQDQVAKQQKPDDINEPEEKNVDSEQDDEHEDNDESQEAAKKNVSDRFNDSGANVDELPPSWTVQLIAALPGPLRWYYDRLCPLRSSGEPDVAVKSGRSYYVPIFVLEMIAAFWMLFGWGSLTRRAIALDSTIDVNSSTFSGAMVLALFLQILFVVLDRIAFLYRSLPLKLLLQYFSVTVFHIWIFISWPRFLPHGLSSNAALIVFYLMKASYFWLSALQIRHGYPAYERHHRALVAKASKVRVLIFKMYRAIPFVAELDILCDWMTTDTSLDLFETYKLEDIYASLYMIKGDLIYRREHKRGEPQWTTTKFFNGTLLFLLLMLIICGPLLIFSTANPVSSANPITRVALTLGLVDVDNPNTEYTLLKISSFNFLTVPDLDYQELEEINIVNEDLPRENVQRVQLVPYADDSWSISPPSRIAFANVLNAASNVKFTATLQFVRKDATIAQSTLKGVDNLRTQDIDKLRQMLQRNTSVSALNVTGVLPKTMQIPRRGLPVAIVRPGQTPSTYDLYLTRTDGVEYWQLRSSDPEPHGPEFITVSDISIQSGLFGALWGASITTFYVTVVLAVGRLLRSIFQNQVHRIMFTDLHDVTDLSLLCEGVFIARKTKEFEMEEALYRGLIRLYRSPESLITISRRREKLKLD